MFTVCTIKRLPVHLEPLARKLAVEMNPANAASTGAVTMSKRWPVGATITVAFLDGTPEQRARVQPHFHEWCEYANLKFIFILNKFNADVRVSFRGGEGSWSVVGVDALLVPKEEPTMVLGWITPDTDEREVRRVTLHEVGHVLSFEHELESPGEGGPEYDEDAIIAFYAKPPHNWTPEETRRQVLEKLSPVGLHFSKFDRHSIMAYAVPKQFVKEGYDGVPWNECLSETDKRIAREAYPW